MALPTQNRCRGASLARRPVSFTGGKGRKERERERKRKGKGEVEREREKEREIEVGKSKERRAEYQERRGGKNTERMREIRIYILVQRSMPSMRLVFNALINV